MKKSRFSEEQIAMALRQAEAGKPGDNARNEAFNGLVRRECFSPHCFLDLGEAAGVLNSWSKENDPERPANCG